MSVAVRAVSGPRDPVGAVMTLRHPDTVLSVAFLGEDTIVTSCQDHTVRVWSTASWVCLQELRGHRRAVLAAVDAGDGVLLSASSDASLRVWARGGARHEASNSLDFAAVAEIGLGSGIVFTLLAKAAAETVSLPDGVLEASVAVFAGLQDTSVLRLSLKLQRGPGNALPSCTVVGATRFGGCTGFVYAALLCPVGGEPGPSPLFWEASPLLIAGSGDGAVRVWDALANAGRDTVACPFSATHGIATCAVPPQAASVSATRSLVSPALSEQQRAHEHGHGHGHRHHGHAHSSRKGGGSTDAWDDVPSTVAQGSAAADGMLLGHCGTVYALACTGRDLFAGTQDACIRVWDIATFHLKYVLQGHTKEVLCLAVCDAEAPRAAVTGSSLASHGPGAPVVASGSADHTVRLWSSRTYMCVAVIEDHRGVVLGLAARGATLLSASADSTVRAFDVATLLAPDPTGARSMALTPRGAAGIPGALLPSESPPSGPLITTERGLGGRPPLASDASLDSVAERDFTVTASEVIRREVSSRDSEPTASASGLSARTPGVAALPPPPLTERFELSERSLVHLLRELVAVPSVSLSEGAQSRDVQACWRAAQIVQEVLQAVGAECRQVQGAPGANPIVIARLGGWKKGVPVVCIHAHYDVQPAGDTKAWESPPFILTGRDGFLYGRGASDNKGPLLAQVSLGSAVHVGHSVVCRAVDTRGPPRDACHWQVFAAARYVRRLEEDGGATLKPLSFVFAIEGEGENGSTGFREGILQNLHWFEGTSVGE